MTSAAQQPVARVVQVDMEESFKWYKLAAEGGHIMAQNNLAAAYYLGEGAA